MDTTTPTWGYKPDGSADIFDLAPGEGLPEGWHASPDCITDPALATAEALSASAEGRAYVLPVADQVSGFRVDGAEAGTIDPDALANALAEIDRLTDVIAAGTAENTRLVAEIEEAEQALDAAASDLVSLKAALTTAQADGGFAVAERDEANARIDALTADLAKAKADLDEMLTAPPAPAVAKPAGKAK